MSTKNRILVIAGASYARPLEHLGEITTNCALFLTEPETFKMLLFTGGEDVTASWYGEESPKGLCYNNEARDLREKVLYDLALVHKIPMMGICRGSQFLNVMNGGRMIHDVTNHANGRGHKMEVSDGEVLPVNSLHHQMNVLSESGILVGWSEKHQSAHYIGNFDEPTATPEKEVEAFLYPETKCAGAQYHPEMMPNGSRGFTWFSEMAEAILEDDDFSAVVDKYKSGDTKCRTHQNTCAG